jgi:hypothetical protein
VEDFWPSRQCRIALTKRNVCVFKHELFISSPAITSQLGLGLDFD